MVSPENAVHFVAVGVDVMSLGVSAPTTSSPLDAMIAERTLCIRETQLMPKGRQPDRHG
jgi:hypothetical protein